MLVPTMCWLARRRTENRKDKDRERTAPEKICSEPLAALRETQMQRAEIENKYLRRLRREAQTEMTRREAQMEMTRQEAHRK